MDRIRGSGRVAKDKKLVFLVDSLENVRGGSVNAKEVSQSVRTVFADHAEKLRLPGVDTVYSVPVYLRILSPNIGSLYGDAIAEIQLTPVRTVDGRRNLPGFERLRSLVGRRGDLNRLLGSGEKLDPISDACGGHLRDVFRLLREAIKITATVPLDHVAVEQAKQILRRDFLPIAKQDADWLHRIHRTKKAAMDSADDATALARFFDTHLVLAYPDSPTWYDVHPLIVGDVAGPHGSGRPSSDTSAPEPATP